jgi:hypothetical protein
MDLGRFDSVEGRADVAGVVPALELAWPVLISGSGARAGALGPGTAGGPMAGVWAVRPGATGVDCLDCRLSCSSSISAFASAIARFERVILRVVRREL